MKHGHWLDAFEGEAVQHQPVWGIHETVGMLVASLVLEPLALIPTSLAVVIGSYGTFGAAGLYVVAGETVLGAASWACAHLLSRKQPMFIRAFRLRAVGVLVWSITLWAMMPAHLLDLGMSRDATVLFTFFVAMRLVMSLAWAGYTFASPRLTATLLHQASNQP